MTESDIRSMSEQGRVPLCFAMADSDMIVTSAESGPKPVFVHALRSEYIPLLVLAGAQDIPAINGAVSTSAASGSDSKTGCILHKFALFAPTSGPVANGMDALLSNVWFDIAGVPVKWHLPVGVLYDYFLHANGLRDQQTSAVMKITVHFQNFPKFIVTDDAGTGFGSILRFPTIDNARSQYFYSLKEAHFIKHGDVNLINKFLPAQMIQLWNAIQLSDVRTFREMNEILCPSLSPSFSLKNVPIRILFDPANPVGQFSVPAEAATVADVITLASESISQAKMFANKADRSNWSLYCNGIRIDDEPTIPLITIYKLFHNFDNYLYFAYVPVPPGPQPKTEVVPSSEPAPEAARPSE